MDKGVIWEGKGAGGGEGESGERVRAGYLRGEEGRGGRGVWLVHISTRRPFKVQYLQGSMAHLKRFSLQRPLSPGGGGDRAGRWVGTFGGQYKPKNGQSIFYVEKIVSQQWNNASDPTLTYLSVPL